MTMIRYKRQRRKLRSEVYDHGILTYLVQTDLKSGVGKYRVFRVDSHTGDVRIIADDLTLREARKTVPKNTRVVPHTVL